jgi:hypothetical protein
MLTLTTILLTTQLASATTLEPLPAEQILERASAVVAATMIDELVWLDPASNAIRTDLVLEDVELLWSDSPDFIPYTLTFTGGELEGRGMAVYGMPAWPIGQRAVYFVQGDGQSEACPTVGWGQGLFLVEPDGLITLDGERLALTPGGELTRLPSPTTRGASLSDISPDDRPSAHHPEDPTLRQCLSTPLDLDTLRERLAAEGGER